MTVPLKAAKVAKAAVAGGSKTAPRGGGRQVVGPKRGQRVTPALQKAMDEENTRLGLDGSTPEPAVSTPAPAPTSSGAGAAAPAMPAAVSTGSGFLLGVFAWALGLAYLRGGAPEVKRFMAAKFLNKTEGDR